MTKDLMKEMAHDAAAEEQRAGDHIGDLSLSEQLSELLRTKDALDEAQAREKEIRARYDKLRKEIVPAQLNEAGIRSFKLPTGESCYLTSDLYVSVSKADEEKLHAWLRDNGLGDIIKPTVHYQTLRATMKELKENGQQLPEFIGYHPYEKVNVRRK